MDGSILTTRAIAKDLADGSIQLDKSALILHIGDISYARGYDTLWDQFFYQLSPITPYLPWMTVDGNHERDFPGSGSMWTGQDSGGECGVALQRRFHMPDAGNTDSSWWSLDVGPVHFVIMSTELDFTKGSPQWNFIAKDLASVDRSKTPFLILAGHRPVRGQTHTHAYRADELDSQSRADDRMRLAAAHYPYVRMGCFPPFLFFLCRCTSIPRTTPRTAVT